MSPSRSHSQRIAEEFIHRKVGVRYLDSGAPVKLLDPQLDFPAIIVDCDPDKAAFLASRAMNPDIAEVAGIIVTLGYRVRKFRGDAMYPQGRFTNRPKDLPTGYSAEEGYTDIQVNTSDLRKIADALAEAGYKTFPLPKGGVGVRPRKALDVFAADMTPIHLHVGVYGHDA